MKDYIRPSEILMEKKNDEVRGWDSFNFHIFLLIKFSFLKMFNDAIEWKLSFKVIIYIQVVSTKWTNFGKILTRFNRQKLIRW